MQKIVYYLSTQIDRAKYLLVYIWTWVHFIYRRYKKNLKHNFRDFIKKHKNNF